MVEEEFKQQTGGRLRRRGKDKSKKEEEEEEEEEEMERNYLSFDGETSSVVNNTLSYPADGFRGSLWSVAENSQCRLVHCCLPHTIDTYRIVVILHTDMIICNQCLTSSPPQLTCWWFYLENPVASWETNLPFTHT